MKKSKVVLGLAVLFCLSFLTYLTKLDSEVVNLEKDLLASPNIIDATKVIETKVYVGAEDLSLTQNWTTNQYDDSKWKTVKIPHYFNTEKDFIEGNFAYYRIRVPKSSMSEFSNLKNEVSLGLYFVLFHKLDYYVNGELIRSNSPKGYNESIIVAPLDESKDNVVAIKGKIKAGDTGIDHRIAIMLGKTAELNQLYTFAYKGQTISVLIYILCKGSILFIFALIFFVVRTESFFEKFLMFGIFTISEDVLTGDHLTSYLSLNQQIYLYDFINIGIVVSLFLFLADVTAKKFNRKQVLIGAFGLAFVSYLVAFDVVKTNYLFNIMHFLKFWNIALILVLIFFLPKIFKVDRILALIITLALGLTSWSTFFSSNVGHNLKAVGNLLLFFMAAYQTFILFKKEQDQLQEKSRQILEQEKDVAIGQTAAILAHDVRRPLEQMNLILDRISSGDFNDEFIKIAKRDVAFSITSVHNQINDIMNFSRNKKIHLSEVSFYDQLAGSLKQVMTISKHVKIDLKYDFKATKLVLADASLLSSVLTNIITNSVEAIRDIGKKQSGIIEFRTYMQDEDFVFSISNDGPQIPEEMIKDIFKPLFTHGKEKGTGLGLASVAKILREHNGSIEAHNHDGGVSFTMKLKAGIDGRLMSMEEFHPSSVNYTYSITPSGKETSLPAVRIFLLDDDLQVYEYMKFLLSSLNFDVELDFVSNLEEAVRKVKDKRYDLYVLDFDLNDELTGLDFYRQNLADLKTKVVIHSNRESISTNVKECSFEHKPISRDNLIKHVDEALKQALKILLVDDSELTLVAWQMFHGKHNLTAVSSPKEALDVVKNRANDIDVCVLDYYFDNDAMNGNDLGVLIQEINPEIKVIIASSSAPETMFSTIHKNDFEIRRRV